jgi:hypothetical protein
MLKRIWKDPVWSKVIAVGIIAIISLLYAKIKSISTEITFQAALQGLINTKIRVIYVLAIILLYLVLRQVLNYKDRSYIKKHDTIRKYNKYLHPQLGILFRWNVYFDDDTPSISDLTPFCTKHDGPPIRFINNRCPMPGCENSRQAFDNLGVTNIIESDLIDRWDKLK